MPAVMRRTPSGARVLVSTCDACGHKRAPFGFRVDGQPSRWYCSADRHLGEAWLAEARQRRLRDQETP